MSASLFVKLDKEINQNTVTLQFTLAGFMDTYDLGVFNSYIQIRVA
jgi:hypothetical protein